MSDFGRASRIDWTPRWALPAAWVRLGCAAGVVAVLAVGVLLLARRVAGGITEDLPAGLLVVTALLSVGTVIGGRYVWRMAPPSRERRDVLLEQALGWGGSVALVLLTLGCSLGRWWDWLVWLPLVGAEQWQLRWFLRGDEGDGSKLRIVDVHEGTISREVDKSLIPPLAPPFEGGGLLLQQLSRVRDEDGVESVHGTLRAEFVAGQRQATLYVGFCPPLARLPVIEAECVDGPDAELKVAQAFCHGARLEVRLGEAAEEDCSVVIEMIAKPQAAI